MKEKKLKEIRLSDVESLEVRAEETEESSKMIIEGYPVVFGKEVYIDCCFDGWFEKIDARAFDNADISDVCLKYNHNDDFFILARTKNDSLRLTFDEKGIFIHAELIDTTQNRDIYKMVQAGLLQEGSFAFTVTEDVEKIDDDGAVHRTITGIGKLFDVAICPNGAYGDLTEIYARSVDAVETVSKRRVETLKRRNLIRLRNKNKIKIWRAKNG